MQKNRVKGNIEFYKDYLQKKANKPVKTKSPPKHLIIYLENKKKFKIRKIFKHNNQFKNENNLNFNDNQYQNYNNLQRNNNYDFKNTTNYTNKYKQNSNNNNMNYYNNNNQINKNNIKYDNFNNNENNLNISINDEEIFRLINEIDEDLINKDNGNLSNNNFIQNDYQYNQKRNNVNNFIKEPVHNNFKNDFQNYNNINNSNNFIKEPFNNNFNKEKHIYSNSNYNNNFNNFNFNSNYNNNNNFNNFNYNSNGNINSNLNNQPNFSTNTYNNQNSNQNNNFNFNSNKNSSYLKNQNEKFNFKNKDNDFNFYNKNNENRNNSSNYNNSNPNHIIKDLKNYKEADLKEWGKKFSWETIIQDINKKVFANKSFRPLQREIINAIMSKKDIFVCIPTGAGKSLTFQLSSIASPGITIVIMPLKSLIQDQMSFMNGIGIKVFVPENKEDIFEKLDNYYEYFLEESGKKEDYKVFFLTPERMNLSNLFKKLLDKLYNDNLLDRFVIDEAHCLSTWGVEFRQDYLELKKIRENYPEIPILAITATATNSIRSHVISQLNMRDPIFFRASYNRPNLFIEVRKKKSNQEEEVADFIKTNYDNQTGIIYCTSQENCKKLSEFLKSKNINANYFHASRTEKEKVTIQEKWKSDRIKVLVATIAFGMGINKADVRFVIHYCFPKSYESYYQEIGRAGRDFKDSHCLLFYDQNDRKALDSFILKNEKLNHKDRENNIRLINMMQDYCENDIECRRKLILKYFDEDFDRKDCNRKCDNCSRWDNIKYQDCSKEIKTVLEFISILSESELTFTQKQIVNFLKGIKETSDKIKNINSEEILYYKGLYKASDTNLLSRILRLLIIKGILIEKIYNMPNRNGISYSQVEIGKEGMNFLRDLKSNKIQLANNKEYQLAVPDNSKKNEDKKKDKKNNAKNLENNFDNLIEEAEFNSSLEKIEYKKKKKNKKKEKKKNFNQDNGEIANENLSDANHQEEEQEKAKKNKKNQKKKNNIEDSKNNSEICDDNANDKKNGKKKDKKKIENIHEEEDEIDINFINDIIDQNNLNSENKKNKNKKIFEDDKINNVNAINYNNMELNAIKEGEFMNEIFNFLDNLENNREVIQEDSNNFKDINKIQNKNNFAKIDIDNKVDLYKSESSESESEISQKPSNEIKAYKQFQFLQEEDYGEILNKQQFEELFEKLKQIRLKLYIKNKLKNPENFEENKIYLEEELELEVSSSKIGLEDIFPNTGLKELCRKIPTAIEELHKDYIFGVGIQCLQKYGVFFLEEIRLFLEKNNIIKENLNFKEKFQKEIDASQKDEENTNKINKIRQSTAKKSEKKDSFITDKRSNNPDSFMQTSVNNNFMISPKTDKLKKQNDLVQKTEKNSFQEISSKRHWEEKDFNQQEKVSVNKNNDNNQFKNTTNNIFVYENIQNYQFPDSDDPNFEEEINRLVEIEDFDYNINEINKLRRISLNKEPENLVNIDIGINGKKNLKNTCFNIKDTNEEKHISNIGSKLTPKRSEYNYDDTQEILNYNNFENDFAFEPFNEFQHDYESQPKNKIAYSKINNVNINNDSNGNQQSNPDELKSLIENAKLLLESHKKTKKGFDKYIESDDSVEKRRKENTRNFFKNKKWRGKFIKK